MALPCFEVAGDFWFGFVLRWQGFWTLPCFDGGGDFGRCHDLREVGAFGHCCEFSVLRVLGSFLSHLVKVACLVKMFEIVLQVVFVHCTYRHQLVYC